MRHPATLVALLALFVALGGTAFAAAAAIDGHSIKNRSIPAVKLTRSAVAQLHGARGPRGFAGAQGPQGLQGAPGVQGPPGIQSLQLVQNSIDVAANSASPVLSATCPASEVAVSGGFIFAGIIIGSTPAGTSWIASGFNDLSTTTTLHVYAYCSPNVSLSAAAGTAPAQLEKLAQARAGLSR